MFPAAGLVGCGSLTQVTTVPAVAGSAGIGTN
jgi:hypothetical protein